MTLLPPYHRDVLYDEEAAKNAVSLLEEILEISESEVIVWFRVVFTDSRTWTRRTTCLVTVLPSSRLER